MKIENNGSDRLSRAQLESTNGVDGTRSAKPAPAKPAQSGKDQVEFSERSRALSKAHTALAEVPAIRTERVEPLRQQVKAGEYQIPYAQLAHRLEKVV